MSAEDNTGKLLSNRDGFQTLQGAFNEEDFSFTTAGFLTGKLGRKVEVTSPVATVDVFTFSEDGRVLYELTLTYTDGTKNTLLSAERTA